jgi:hypothetical protein
MYLKYAMLFRSHPRTTLDATRGPLNMKRNFIAYLNQIVNRKSSPFKKKCPFFIDLLKL